MHLGLGSLMPGLAQIAHEKCQKGLEKKHPLHTHRPSHTSAYIKDALSNTCLLHYQISHPASSQSRLGSQAAQRKQIACVFVS